MSVQFLWLAASAGALSLLTPCVFPMVPITVSYFTQHGAATRSASIRQALLFGLGIVASFTALGLVLAVFVGATSVVQLAANPWVNLALAGVFIAFALNLFGVYQVAIPQPLARGARPHAARSWSTGTRLGRCWRGAHWVDVYSDLVHVHGALRWHGARDRGPGQLAFATRRDARVFDGVRAAVLPPCARAPNCPQASARRWMVGRGESHDGVRGARGRVEVPIERGSGLGLGALHPPSRAGKLGGAGASGCWLRASCDAARVGRWQCSATRGARSWWQVAGWLSLHGWRAGLAGRPLGALEAFLPLEEGASSSAAVPVALPWRLNDYAASLAQAKAGGKRVFIDFTGYTCTNCRWMEANMFTRPDVRAELRRYVLSRLFTDGDGEMYERQQAFQQGQFHTVALPLYAIVDADGRTVAALPGLTRDPSTFVAFLQRGLTP